MTYDRLFYFKFMLPWVAAVSQVAPALATSCSATMQPSCFAYSSSLGRNPPPVKEHWDHVYSGSYNFCFRRLCACPPLRTNCLGSRRSDICHTQRKKKLLCILFYFPILWLFLQQEGKHLFKDTARILDSWNTHFLDNSVPWFWADVVTGF